MLHFYRALSALVPLNWKIQGVGSIISPSTVRIVIVGVQPRFAVRGSMPSNIGRDVIGSPQHRFPAIATLATVAWETGAKRRLRGLHFGHYLHSGLPARSVGRQSPFNSWAR